MKFTLPTNVDYIISKMEEYGYHAHIVGGSVRDFLLGKIPDDYDITTDATPDETKSVFSEHLTVDTGIKHGTVSLILERKPYEITTYRVDGEYKDSRHPESVSFTRNIREDLARRDFTVNAMAYNHGNGIIDPFGGRSDLKDKIIRAVGDPDRRFSEDALRILRGIRFSATLGFDIEPLTSNALRNKADMLKNVSSERIYVELKKTLSAPFAYEVIGNYSDVILQVIPAIDRIQLPSKERFESSDYMSRLLSIFHLSSTTPKSAFESSCKALHTDNHIRDIGCAVLDSVGRYDLTSEISLTHALRELGSEATGELVKLEILLDKTGGNALQRLDSLLRKNVCYSLSQLEVNGADMMALGICGKEIGIALSHILDAVIDRKVDNRKADLMRFAENQLKQK